MKGGGAFSAFAKGTGFFQIANTMRKRDLPKGLSTECFAPVEFKLHSQPTEFLTATIPDTQRGTQCLQMALLFVLQCCPAVQLAHLEDFPNISSS